MIASRIVVPALVWIVIAGIEPSPSTVTVTGTPPPATALRTLCRASGRSFAPEA